MALEMIAALDEEGGIGLSGRIPWDVPGDMAHFRAMTMGHSVVMGRKTFDSLGQKPLPGRFCAVWTRFPERYSEATGCFFSSDIEACLRECGERSETVYAIGGAQLYGRLMAKAHKIWISRIPGVWHCDVFFPPLPGFELAWTKPMPGFTLECWHSMAASES
ncbi:MAG: dihydrofolate reductase [Proteobacteria bacterium]|nr:dihydrofolate reductase [Pseudomonadota bacterium]